VVVSLSALPSEQEASSTPAVSSMNTCLATHTGSDLEVPRFGGRLPPLVVATVGEAHGRRGQLGGVGIVEAGELHRNVFAADFRDVAAFERTHTAVFAEQVLPLFAAEAVVAQCIGARQETEGVGFDERTPVADLGAEAAITFAGALRQVDVGFEANCTAVTAAVIGLFHLRL